MKLIDVLLESEVSPIDGQPLLKWFLDRINNTFVFFDTETTGLLKKDEKGNQYRAETEQITQLAGIATELNGETLRFMEIDKFNQKIKLNDVTKGLMQNEPDAPASDDPKDVNDWNFKTKKGILKFNHYDLANSESFEDERKVLENFDSFLQKQGGNITLIAHNAPFDLTFIQFHDIFKESTYEVIDSIEFFDKFFFPIMKKLSETNPETAEKYNSWKDSSFHSSGKSPAIASLTKNFDDKKNNFIQKQKSAHDALVDCQLTIELVEHGLFTVYRYLDTFKKS
jgi:DNA polymerase III epsilon subunit-like protein